MQIVTLPTLLVTATGSAPRSRGPGFAVTAEDGAALGAVSMTGLSFDGKLRRWFGEPAEYPFTLTLHDPDGAVVLLMDKARENAIAHYLRASVRLADGREIGMVEKRTLASDRIVFSEPHGGHVASAAIGRFSAAVAVEREPGRDAVWARSELDVSGPNLSDRRYRLTFAPDAPVLVRVLLLAWVCVADAQLLPSGGDY